MARDLLRTAHKPVVVVNDVVLQWRNQKNVDWEEGGSSPFSPLCFPFCLLPLLPLFFLLFLPPFLSFFPLLAFSP